MKKQTRTPAPKLTNTTRSRGQKPVTRRMKAHPSATMSTEKLQKLLAETGIGSRRTIESWIAAGRIQVNGALATIGLRVTRDDKITIDGKAVKLSQTDTTVPQVLLYHKREGEICSRNDPEGRPSVFDELPPLQTGRWISVGRLDINTTGLLLFTDNGELANRLMHPSAEIEREYAVRVLGDVDGLMLELLTQGILDEEGHCLKFDQVIDAGGQGANHWYHVILKEGRNREVRKLWESVGCKVSRLTRVRFGQLMLPRSLRPGRYRLLSEQEIALFSPSRRGFVAYPHPRAVP